MRSIALTAFVLLTCVAATTLGSAASQSPPSEGSPPRYGTYLRQISDLHDPLGIAVGPDDTTYVSDTDVGRIRVIDPAGETVGEWVCGDDETPGAPTGLAVAEDGVVYASDQATACIRVFSPDGTQQAQWYGGPGGDNDDGRFDRPTGLAVGGSHVFVADTGNDRIQVFDRDGVAKRTIGSRGTAAGELIHPLDVTVDDRGNLYVADTGNHRIQKFGPDGRFVAEWGGRGTFPGLFASPTGIAWQAGRLYVVDRFGHRVQVFNEDGDVLYQWGRHAFTPRENEGKIHYPDAIAVSPTGSFIVVAEGIEDRCQVFGVDTTTVDDKMPPRVWGKQSHFSSRLVTDGPLLATWEPESLSVIMFDLRNEVPTLISQFGEYGRRLGQFAEITDICLDFDDRNVMVSDRGNRRVDLYRYDHERGERLRYKPRMNTFVKSWAFHKLGGGHIEAPHVIAMERGTDGYLYVIDGRGSRILVMDDAFGVVRSWGKAGTGDGEFRRPTDIALSPDGQRVYVVDAWNRRVQVFDATGVFQTSWGAFGTGPGEFINPFGVTVGSDGSVYVTDAGSDRVQKFDASGEYLTEWGSTGLEHGQFWRPMGIVQDEDQRLIVMDYGNHRLQVFSPDGEWLVTFGLGRAYTRQTEASKRED